MRAWEGWDVPGVAEEVDQTWTKSHSELEYRTALALAVTGHIQEGMSVLEVGCGTGLVYGELKRFLPKIQYVGVDVSEKMVAIARKRFPEADFRGGDIFDLEYGNRSFDVVLCFEVLGHLPEIVNPIAELERVCRRELFFTAWKTGYKTTITERVLSTDFIKTSYSDEDITMAVRCAGVKAPIVASDMNKAIRLYRIRTD